MQVIAQTPITSMSSREIAELAEKEDQSDTWECTWALISVLNSSVANHLRRLAEDKPTVGYPHEIVRIVSAAQHVTKNEDHKKAIRHAVHVAEMAFYGSVYFGVRGRNSKVDQRSVKTYLIACDETKSVKIGKSINPEKRVRSLRTGNSGDLTLIATISADVERQLHKRFAEFRTGGEWFDAEEVGKWIADGIKSLNYQTRFTPEGIAWVAKRYSKAA